MSTQFEELRVYVAGASGEIERAEKAMAKLRQAGIVVTSSWPEVIRKVGAANPMGAPREARAEWARTDLAELAASNVFWFLLPEGLPTAGAYTELGFATSIASMLDASEKQGGENIPPFEMVCSGKETSIFTALIPYAFDTDDEALGFLFALHESLQAARIYLDSIDNADDDDDDDDEEFDESEEDDIKPEATYTGTNGSPIKLSPTMRNQLDAIFKKPSV